MIPRLFAATLTLTCALAVPPLAAQEARMEEVLEEVLEEADALEPLQSVLVARAGAVLAARGYHGHDTESPTPIMSASKSVISALVGIAIDKGLLEGPDQPIAPILASRLPADPDPRLREVTVGNLLSMQAGLGSTSGRNYGRWVNSPNWVRFALAQDFEDDPGGRMIYSTGSSHLLSAILTEVSGRSTLALARDWLGPLEGFRIAGWDRDPQGIYVGGNLMAMSPRSLLAFGELYRRGGRTAEGRQLLSRDWIEASWQSRTRSRYTGHGYGYGWFSTRIAGQEVHYGWGYGGQMVYVVPALQMTVAMTSDNNSPSSRTGHRDDLHDLLGDMIAAVEAAPDVVTD